MHACISVYLFGSTIPDRDGCLWTSRIRSVGFHFLDKVQTIRYLSKDNVLSVQPGSVCRADEELRSVGVGPGVGHRKGSGTAVAEIKVLVLKGAAVDGLSTGPVAICEVSPLAHEPGNDAVKAGALKALSLSLEAQLLEVFDRLWDRRPVQAHFDAAGIGSVNVDIKINRLGDFGIGGSSA